MPMKIGELDQNNWQNFFNLANSKNLIPIPAMPKLPRLKPKRLIRALKRVGYVVDHISGSHYILYKDNTCPPLTVPYHNKDLKTGTLHSILKQAKISVNQLIDLL